MELWFDTDFDHPMESVQYGHPERVAPFCVREVTVCVRDGQTGEREIAHVRENRRTRQVIVLTRPVTTDLLRLRLTAPGPHVPAALFDVRCYGE